VIEADEETNKTITNEETKSQEQTSFSQATNDDTRNEEPIWDELCSYEPARESIYRLLDSRYELDRATAQIEEAMDKFNMGLETEVQKFSDKIVETFNDMEDHALNIEYDVESYFMDNHQRKVANQKKLKQSAERAQQLFSNLLSGLYQSMS
jgi:hypothetical protein